MSKVQDCKGWGRWRCSSCMQHQIWGLSLWMFNYDFTLTNNPPTLTCVGHRWTVSTNIGCNQWLSLANPCLKVLLVGRDRLMVVRIGKCRWAIRLCNSQLFKHCLVDKVACIFKFLFYPWHQLVWNAHVIQRLTKVWFNPTRASNLC